MMRPLRLGVILSLCLVSPARADLAPPPPSSTTIELTLDGQESLPGRRIFLVNCGASARESVVEEGKSIVCGPIKGLMPIPVFAVREADLPKLLALPPGAAATKFLDENAKRCGELGDANVIRPGGGARRISARYELQPGADDGCKLVRLSTEDAAPRPEPVKPLAASAAPTPEPSPSANASAPRARNASCGCRSATSGGSVWGALSFAALGLGLAARRSRHVTQLPRRARPAS